MIQLLLEDFDHKCDTVNYPFDSLVDHLFNFLEHKYNKNAYIIGLFLGQAFIMSKKYFEKLSFMQHLLCFVTKSDIKIIKKIANTILNILVKSISYC
jgi:hypothetical protein